jgi:SAM-dependent methyltransferase
MPADWQLPPGVNRGLCDYLHDPAVARGYDASLAGSTLFQVDQTVAERFFDRPGKLIDLGCGTGRLAVVFAARGYSVVAVDLSEEMLAVTAAKARAAGVVVQGLKANLVDLDCLRDGVFDYAACLFSTLGMVVGSVERRRVIGHVHRLLRPGGRFLLHVHNRWFNAWDPEGRRWLLRNGLRSLWRREGAGDRRMPVHQGIAGLTLHLFTRREAVGLLRRAGFRIRAVQPISLRPHGRLPCRAWFGWLRAHGYLLAAEKLSAEAGT